MGVGLLVLFMLLILLGLLGLVIFLLWLRVVCKGWGVLLELWLDWWLFVFLDCLVCLMIVLFLGFVLMVLCYLGK